MAYKNIHIGSLLKERVEESNLDMTRITRFFKCSEEEILNQFEKNDLYCEDLLKWSKLLEYDFFRIYTQHLILHAPQRNVNYNKASAKSLLYRSSGKTSIPKKLLNLFWKRSTREKCLKMK